MMVETVTGVNAEIVFHELDASGAKAPAKPPSAVLQGSSLSRFLTVTALL
jgi:hypothetical protein